MALSPPSSSRRQGTNYGNFMPRSGGSNAEGHTPGRGLSVGEIYAQRENRPNARYADGAPVPAGMRINSPGWNTSGVGPGTRGYTGSWRPGGYNYGEGTRRPSARTSGEFYAQRDEMQGNPLDNLELGNSNLMDSFLQNAMNEARGVGGTGFRSGSPESIKAQQQAVFDKTQSFMPGADPALGGPSAGPTPGSEADVMQLIKEARAQEAMDSEERAMLELEAMKPRDGSGMTTPGATMDGMPSDLWFQYKANEGGANQFATPPYAGGDDTKAWQFSNRLAPFLKKLGVGQAFPARKPL